MQVTILLNLERILSLIKMSKEKGIHLTFILSPRSATYKILSLSKNIPSDNFIDMADPDKFASLYDSKNSFDFAHLNIKGAITYSKLLANEFVKLNK